MKINWYPGHMKKTRERLLEDLKKVDLVLEILDARVPISSKNPDMDSIIGNKGRIFLLNKSDLADEKENQRWKSYFETNSNKALITNALENKSLKNLRPIAESLLIDKFERLESKGIKDKTIRMMIVGIPNVGKSTLINSISKRRGTRVGNRPGVTRQNQWIKTNDDIELLDTPGILWPNIKDPRVGRNLVYTAAIDDDIMDMESLALNFIEDINKINSNILKERYGIEYVESTFPLEILEMIGNKRGALNKGGLYDYDRIQSVIFSDFRKGLLGRITLETVDDK